MSKLNKWLLIFTFLLGWFFGLSYHFASLGLDNGPEVSSEVPQFVPNLDSVSDANAFLVSSRVSISNEGLNKEIGLLLNHDADAEERRVAVLSLLLASNRDPLIIDKSELYSLINKSNVWHLLDVDGWKLFIEVFRDYDREIFNAKARGHLSDVIFNEK